MVKPVQNSLFAQDPSLGQALFSSGRFGCFAADSSITTGIRTNFAPQAILSSAQLATVIKLARKCGVPDVAEISTFNSYHPSPFFSIGVKSSDVTRGREVCFVTATIDCEKWTSRGFRRSSRIFKSLGGFWVARGDVWTNVLTTFTVPGGTARVRLSDTVALPTADRIVEAFATGKVRYSDEVKRVELKGVDFSQPIWLGRNRERFCICFSTGPWSMVSVYFRVDAAGVTVVGIDTMVS